MKIKNIKSIGLLLAFGIAAFSIAAPAATQSQYMADYTSPVFPADNALNARIDSLPVHSNSDNYINSMGRNTTLHPDFGSSWDDEGTLRPMGIPYNVVGANQPKVPITFISWPEESDPGPWPIPSNPFIETVFDWKDQTDGDRHMLIVDSSSHILYETGGTEGNSSGTSWEGGCGAVFYLDSNKLRPAGWTSADAAGLPIFPLLIRYDEVSRAMATGGEMPHPIRFTAANTQKAYIWPARHYASSSIDPNRPPMGLRVRLKASVDITGYSPRMQVILRTMKKFGMIMSDNGSNWFFQGTHDDRWDNEDISSLSRIRGGDFEVVDISVWTSRPGFNPNSARVPPASGVLVSPQRRVCQPQNLIVTRHFSHGFKMSIFISFNLETSGFASIKVFDISGKELWTPVRGVKTACAPASAPAGAHAIEWDGKDAAGQRIRNKSCFVRLQCANGFTITKKVMLFDR